MTLRRRQRARPGRHRGVVRGRLRRRPTRRSSTSTTGAVQLAFAGPVPPAAVPTTLVLDPEGRVAARVSGQLTDAVDPRLDHRRPARRAGDVHARGCDDGRRRRDRAQRAAARSRCRSRSPRGSSRSSRRACCRSCPGTSATSAGSPRPRPTREERRNRRRLVLGVLLFIAGFTLVFVAFNLARGRRRAPGCCSTPTCSCASRGVVLIVHGARLHRPVQLPAAHDQADLAARAPASPAHRCSASCSPSAGRRASARPSRSCSRSAPTRPRPAAACCSASLYCLGLGIPFLLVALGFGWVTGVAGVHAPAHPRDQHRRRVPAHRDRRADGHRALEHLDVRTAGGDHRLCPRHLNPASSRGPPTTSTRPSRPPTRRSTINQPKLGFVGWLRFALAPAHEHAHRAVAAAAARDRRGARARSCRSASRPERRHPVLQPTTRELAPSSTASSCSTSTRRPGSRRSTCCCSSRSSAASSRARSTTSRRCAPGRRARPRGSRGSPGTPSGRCRAEPGETADAAVEPPRAAVQLRQAGYRVERTSCAASSVSAERGYLRETGNLVFHTALVGVLVAVGFGGGFGFTGQRVIVEGQTFVNTLAATTRSTPGASSTTRARSRTACRSTSSTRSTRRRTPTRSGSRSTSPPTSPCEGRAARRADARQGQRAARRSAAPTSTCSATATRRRSRCANADGDVVFTDAVPFLPQDANLTSSGVIKVPDGMPEQLGMVGFFYPTQSQLDLGRLHVELSRPDPAVLTLQRLRGRPRPRRRHADLVYTLDPSSMEQLTGGDTGVDSIELKPGETAELPNGLGTVTFETTPTPGRRRGRLLAERAALRELRHPPRPDAGLGARVRGRSSSAGCSCRCSCRAAACG